MKKKRIRRYPEVLKQLFFINDELNSRLYANLEHSQSAITVNRKLGKDIGNSFNSKFTRMNADASRKRARAYASGCAPAHTCKRDFTMCWGCWKAPAIGVFCPSCGEKDKQDQIKNVEIEFARKEVIKQKAQARRGNNEYYNY